MVPIAVEIGDKERWKVAAQEDGLTLSAFMRTAAESRARQSTIFKKNDFEALADIHGQIRQAGVNLNQLLHQSYLFEDGHTTRKPKGVMIENSCQEIATAIHDLREFMERFSASN